MRWYSEQRERFPAAVQRAALPDGAFLAGKYRIQNAITVSGTELYYAAEDVTSGKEVCLCELLPLQWCMPDENRSFVPYRPDAGMQWELLRNRAFARLERLLTNPEDAAPVVLDVFEEKGTVWYASALREEQPLSRLLAERIIAPDKAIHLLSPVMDTLAGLHSEGIFHGSITAGAIRLCTNRIELRDWNSFEGKPTAATDVNAVSRLLWQMMTGETEYRSLTAASLPAAIRNALYNGMFDPEMTITSLWEQLHAKTPAKRSRTAAAPASGHSVWQRILNPVVTIVFCVVCVTVPLVLRFVRIQQNKPSAATSSVRKLPDVSYALSAEEIRLPELLYLTQEEATAQLEELGLGVILAKSEDNPVIPENCVITQKPDAGTILRAGDVVTLSLSGGWSNYVPDVTNMLLDKATERLEELGFVVEYEEIFSPGDAPGTVISQDVKAETKLERDSVIHLEVSLGRKDLDASKLEKVDDYVGMDFEEAKTLLSEIYLYAMEAEAVYDPEIPEGVIISQDIAAGRQVPQGTIVNMKVSLGVQKTRVPGVVMMNAGSAREMLEAAGLKCMLCYVADSHVIDYVLTQNVKAGMLVPVGTEVWLNVSVGSVNHVASTGGWSGAQLPTFETEEQSENPEQPPEESAPEDMPGITDPVVPATDPPIVTPPEPTPTEPPTPVTPPEPTSPPPTPADPPAPVIPVPDPGEDLPPPPMPDLN